ncbi:toxin secretion/phage lysis holin [Moryella indoligenes]|uniref:Toxin secretion/phage lysis holin n=1 Tax=Moryella indoligenes TaxID=371674 RepID=A0AAE4ALW2_9FIRM|nr:phage holin family protein [Moryella indoligenes]MDQ0153610.1 toxin secretion/phage lysis holin [Moryella indoligenes]
MKTRILTVIGAAGGALISLLGGWDYAMKLLVISMAIDYTSGLMVAGIWHKSSKSKSGALESRAGFKGLCRKGMVIGLVLLAHYMDLAIGTQYIRNALVVGYSANEILSILENTTLMGVSYPAPLKNALELLKNESRAKQ